MSTPLRSLRAARTPRAASGPRFLAPGLTAGALLLLSLAAGCGDDDPSPSPGDTGVTEPDTDAGEDAVAPDAPDAGEDVAPDLVDPETVLPAPESGATLRMDPAADFAADFFAYPYPADLRLSERGTAQLGGVATRTRSQVTRNLLEAADDLRGYPSLPVGWFAFSEPLAPQDQEVVRPGTADQDVLLVLVEPGHPDRGMLAPTIARTLDEDAYVDANVLAVGAQPGYVLTPGVRWAWVVRRSLGDATGTDLGVPAPLWNRLHGATSGDDTVDAELAPLVSLLPTLGLAPDEIAAATVFTTASVVEELHTMSERLRDAYAPQIVNLTVPAGRGLTWEGYCELHGEIVLPQFQRGTPSFNTQGLFEIGADDLPIRQRDETIPVVVTVPRATMPADGFPLVLYFHGSGGISTQLVDRGPQPGPGQPETPGEGPAFVLARHGFGMAGSAHPVNPERVPGASGLEYLNFSNLKAFRDTFRQGVIEQRLYLDALLALEIDPALLTGCEGAALPDGEVVYRFDASNVYAMGQSMGGMYTNMVGAVEPRIRAVVPTGAGGFWSYFILETDLVPGAAALIGNLLQTRSELSHLHPAMHILQTAWEFAEPFVYTPRLARDPLEGHPVRPIYQPVGQGDSFFPTPIFDAITIAYGNQQAGNVVWGDMQTALAVTGLDGIASYPVVDNRTAADGTDYTGVVVQYAGDGFTDPHNIFAQFEEVKHQYGCFFASFLATGRAVVPAPASLATDCPSL